jgi:ribonuclease T2
MSRISAILLSVLLAASAGCKQVPPATAVASSNAAPRLLDLQPHTQGFGPAPTSCYDHGKGELDGAQPNAFDYYLLTLSWQPQYCATHANGAGCGQQLGFIVHGLWPEDNNGDYPACCSNAPGPTNPASVADIMPGIPIAHEWQKHGTCTTLTGDQYLSDIRQAFSRVQIPASLTNLTQSASLSRDALLSQFASANPTYPAGSIALVCSGKRLSAAEVCLNKSSLAPQACQNLPASCPTTVSVTAP